jgi:4-amino-4-deoxy-L-arabinose transferase-like glycosyltransferase
LTEVHRTTRTKEKILFLFLIPFFLYLSLLPVMPLIEPDEARYSDISSLMNRTGDYVTPHLFHLVYLEKPPLCYWATALSFKIFGESEFSSRLFVALCAWGCILLVYRIGTFFRDEITGLYSAGVLSTFLFHSIVGKVNILDMPLTLFVCLGIWAGYRHFAGDGQRKGWIYLFYVSSALAFLTKGLIGVVFPFAVMILWRLVSGRWRDGLRLFSPGGIVLFLLISCPWIILVQKANPDFLWFFFVKEHFLRYTTSLHRRDEGLLFYLPIVALGTLPWSAFLLKAWKEGKIRGTPLFKADEIRFFLVWILFIFIFFSVSSSQLPPYIGPIFLPLAVIFARLFRLYEERSRGLEKGRGRRLLYHLPVFLPTVLFISALLLPLFIENVKIGKHLVRIHFEYEWRLMILPVLFQGMIVFLPGLVQKKWGRGWFPTIAVLSALFLISVHFPIARFLAPRKSALPVSKAIHAWVPPNGKVLQYDVFLYGIDFYNHIRTPVHSGIGELAYGYFKLPEVERRRYFLSSTEFFEQCQECVEIYCVTRYKKNVEKLRKEFPTLEVLWDNGYYYLLRLRR